MKIPTVNEEKWEKFLKELEGNPAVVADRFEKIAQTRVKRKEAAGKIAVLAKDREKVIPQLQADLAGKEGEYQKARAALEAAGGEFNKAKAALSMESQSFDNKIRRQEAILYETAAPEIDEAIKFFKEKLDFLRTPGRISRTASGSVKNLFAWKKTVKEESNVAAVKGALVYCQSAIKALEALKLSPVLDAEKIERIKAGVPSIDVYAEYQGEKPLERGPDPLAGLKSESHLNYELAKLNEKIKKVIKR